MPRRLCSCWPTIRVSRLDRAAPLGSGRPQSTANHALVSLVDQDVGDDRGFPRLQAVTGCLIAGLQFSQFLLARWGSEQGSQLLLPLLKGFRRAHKFILSEWVWVSCGAGMVLPEGKGSAGYRLRVRGRPPDCAQS